jgi:hypothetical protein
LGLPEIIFFFINLYIKVKPFAGGDGSSSLPWLSGAVRGYYCSSFIPKLIALLTSLNYPPFCYNSRSFRSLSFFSLPILNI